MVDLHTHTNKSDGTYTPRELMDYAVQKGLKAIAITDHDTTDGIDEAFDHIREKNLLLELIPGTEFSTVWQMEEREQEIHVVGLFVDYKQDAYAAHLKGYIESRVVRNRKMCELLTQAGMPVTPEALEEANPGAVITRAHFGRYLLEQGYVRTRKEAFDRYIGEGCPCFIPRRKVTPFEAVRVILHAGGVPVLAHPMLYHLTEEELRRLAREMKEAGLVGIEALYSTHTREEERLIRRIAKEYDLCVSGGSDFHGANKPGLDLATGYGSLFVPDDILETLRQHKGKQGNR
ncbi:MAG: PHP domain-containing protein [Lachnospiraceae bacterium]|nr:PHP domain-containing protein [Lachnospiraceae bacterium]